MTIFLNTGRSCAPSWGNLGIFQFFAKLANYLLKLVEQLGEEPTFQEVTVDGVARPLRKGKPIEAKSRNDTCQ